MTPRNRMKSLPMIPVLALGLLLCLPAISPAFQGTDSADEIDCDQCHDCEHPSKLNPCLKSRSCPRHEAMGRLDADQGPDIIILDELSKLYVPVRFDHKAHAGMERMSEGCEHCHHFTPPNSPHPACKDCHPVEILHEDIAQPGLKGAYHRNCMACHKEWDNDTACEICHEKVVPGKPSEVCEHSHYEPIELMELITFETGSEEGSIVPFHHRNHSQLYERDCAECHQQQSCERCHVHGEELHPMGEPDVTDLHDTCFKCHFEERCQDCHGRDPDDLFSHSSTGWKLQSYHEGLRCRACHGQRGPFMKLNANCWDCHPDGWDTDSFDHARYVGVNLGEEHEGMECADCHPDPGCSKVPVCEDCHDDQRGVEWLRDPGHFNHN